MAVDNPTVIDAVGTERETGIVVLTVSDHLEWDSDHLITLQEKLNAYLHFVLEGQLLEDYPSARNRRVRIEVIHKFEPHAEALEFLSKARVAIAEHGIELAHKSLPSGY
ncbi:MAG TPA: hypothetical protein PLB02_01990 [Thermoanaerobaculia bacterium]|nr:hypothetical protein [Thermoanaerobaculia bacterium]HQR66140.1 hypothetical protein [Thermoanaerobaculia bacterium]